MVVAESYDVEITDFARQLYCRLIKQEVSYYTHSKRAREEVDAALMNGLEESKPLKDSITFPTLDDLLLHLGLNALGKESLIVGEGKNSLYLYREKIVDGRTLRTIIGFSMPIILSTAADTASKRKPITKASRTTRTKTCCRRPTRSPCWPILLAASVATGCASK